ncbi:hypothetical protein NPIL_80531 [Nephila pilipes]|uniref:Uncharacterized protein n=1 Tax=Nephila pilipes TaxID=299642 RepID=A0A8X6IQ19_NEPPI|nr:hypothetical protein NPIL_80531 [Nephila pilipes]
MMKRGLRTTLHRINVNSLKPKNFKETSLNTKASLEIEGIMNFLLPLVILFSLDSIIFGSENPDMKGSCLKTLFPFPMDQDLTKNRNGRPGAPTSDIPGRPIPICIHFGCEELEVEDCSIPPGAQCCKGFSYDSRSDHELDPFSAYVLTKVKLLSEKRDGFVQLDKSISKIFLPNPKFYLTL